MKFKSISQWTITPEVEGLLFFAQRFDELVWDFTLDTYKPMSLNAPFLCKEALVVIENIESDLIDSANLKPVLEELIWSVQNDPIAKALLDLPIERYVSVDDEAKLSERKRRLSALSNTLGPFRYLHECFDQLVLSVRGVKKKKIDQITRTIKLMNLSKQFIRIRMIAMFILLSVILLKQLRSRLKHLVSMSLKNCPQIYLCCKSKHRIFNADPTNAMLCWNPSPQWMCFLLKRKPHAHWIG